MASPLTAPSPPTSENLGFCTACFEGELSSADRTSCGACVPGEFVLNAESVQSCESCPQGTYAPVALTDACLDW